jgi:predicted transcriptional regulator
MKNKAMMKETLKAFNMTYQEFSKHSGIPKGTLEGWTRNGISQIGEIVLNLLIKKKAYEIMEKEYEALVEKGKDFDKMLETISKYNARESQ